MSERLIPEDFERDTYRAVGRYVVEFSGLIAWMRWLLSDRLNSDPPFLAELALADANPNQVANSFFGMCLHLADLDQGEQKVASRLRGMVGDEINRRNDIAHGDWFVFPFDPDDSEADSAEVVRIRPTRKEGVIKTIDVSAGELDEWSDALADLRFMVIEFGLICLDRHRYQDDSAARVKDVFVMRSGEVARDGPRAGEFPTYKMRSGRVVLASELPADR